MTDLSRRNFLKGLMAAAGVAAVGMPVIAAVEAVAVPALPFPDHDVGDVFMKVNDVWRLLGKSTSLTVNMARSVSFASLEQIDRLDHRYYCLPDPMELSVEALLDNEGRGLLMGEFSSGRHIDFAMSQGENGLYMIKKSFIREVCATCRHELVIDSFELNPSEIEVTIPAAEAV
ncbi:twin-arginine translocation signal domain-containing protein [Mesorhizobium sp. M1B.F.Ca.ET.045.04.1.1]|uniref:twin-arginine translocation signal domain-containing protein n=1 Tax=Mesorhizobium sp. M1B.F.Ca.ET.045.04.1.1 TaxID=2493673 RepID=UPI000F764F6E|nr:twin-arginine translocation signal domain-containing protein [Mesorhizobium sp. M1B.F.Ca.ET.045.04.1.1]AZO29399.1 twin-arginine translocation signal domain-containing protein [Mesorhizobium sp. M1B.F.Ca.ET.045.04.1.1]